MFIYVHYKTKKSSISTEYSMDVPVMATLSVMAISSQNYLKLVNNLADGIEPDMQQYGKIVKANFISLSDHSDALGIVLW